MTDTNDDTAERNVNVSAVRVVDRHRRDLGDIEGLMRSIEDVGLINPITLTPGFELVAGGRRLEAYRRIGRGTIPARIVDTLADAAAALRVERDENTCREDMLPSELAALGEALYEFERPKAEESLRLAQERGRATRSGVPMEERTGAPVQKGKTSERVGQALGVSGRTYEELRSAYRLAHDNEVPEDERELGQRALEEMDRTRAIKPAARKMHRDLRAKRDAQDAKKAALADPESTKAVGDTNWIPTAEEKGAKPSARRRELIREWSAKGWTSHQIGDRLGITPITVRRNAREQGISIAADELFGRSRQGIDSNRIVRETVNQLDGMEMALDLIHYDEIDRSEIENWTTSLTKSIRVLSRLNKKLKEMVQ